MKTSTFPNFEPSFSQISKRHNRTHTTTTTFTQHLKMDNHLDTKSRFLGSKGKYMLEVKGRIQSFDCWCEFRFLISIAHPKSSVSLFIVLLCPVDHYKLKLPSGAFWEEENNRAGENSVTITSGWRRAKIIIPTDGQARQGYSSSSQQYVVPIRI